MSECPLSSVTRNMPLPSASRTSPSISSFSSANYSLLSATRGLVGRAIASYGLDVDRLRAFRPLTLVVLDASVLAQRLEAAARDVGVVDEQVLATLVGRDEAVSLRVVE